MRVRVGGNYFRAWVENLGGVAVSIPGTETYEALNAGTLDAYLGSISDITGFGIGELVSSVTLVGAGSWHNGSFTGAGLDFWRALPVEHRRIILQLSVEGQAKEAISVDSQDIELLAEIRKNGTKVLEPSAEFTAATNAFAAKYAQEVVENAQANLGLAEAPALAAKFAETVARWNELVKTIDASDYKAVADLYQREVYSKLDIDTFGM